MDYLMNKMKVLLDEDGKPKKDDKSNTDMPAASYGERSLTDQPGGQGGYPPQPQSYPPQPQSYPPQLQSYPPQPQSYPLQQQPYPPAAPGQYQYQQQQQPYSTQGPGYYQQPQQQPYGQGAPVPQGPPAPYGPPPPMPSGWFQQWDQANQRAYYVEQATGRTQWDPPHSPPPSSAPYQAQAGHDERGLFGNTQGHGGHDYAQAPAGYPAAAPVAYAPVQEKKKDKDSGHSTAMLAAAGIGGLAAGAWIGHELTEDDNEEKAGQLADTAAYGDSAFAPPPPVPTHDEDGSSISSSDREEMEEKRQELIEAQEEYLEEVEEHYSD